MSIAKNKVYRMQMLIILYCMCCAVLCMQSKRFKQVLDGQCRTKQHIKYTQLFYYYYLNVIRILQGVHLNRWKCKLVNCTSHIQTDYTNKKVIQWIMIGFEHIYYVFGSQNIMYIRLLTRLLFICTKSFNSKNTFYKQ